MSRSNGFIRKAAAPARIALAIWATSFSVVQKTTLGFSPPVSSFLRCARNSTPSMTGIDQSSRMRSGIPLRHMSSACAPSSASLTSNSSSSMIRRATLRTTLESSMIKHCFMFHPLGRGNPRMARHTGKTDRPQLLTLLEAATCDCWKEHANRSSRSRLRPDYDVGAVELGRHRHAAGPRQRSGVVALHRLGIDRDAGDVAGHELLEGWWDPGARPARTERKKRPLGVAFDDHRDIAPAWHCPDGEEDEVEEQLDLVLGHQNARRLEGEFGLLPLHVAGRYLLGVTQIDLGARRACRPESESRELQLRRSLGSALADQVESEILHVLAVLLVEDLETIDDRTDRRDDVVAHPAAQKCGKIERFEFDPLRHRPSSSAKATGARESPRRLLLRGIHRHGGAANRIGRLQCRAGAPIRLHSPRPIRRAPGPALC